MPATKEEKQTEIQLKVDIERLEAQKNTLKTIIDNYAKQTDELYEKRSIVAQEVEALKIGIEDERKKINIERGSLETLRKDIQKEDQSLKTKGLKLAEEKQTFKEERRIYEKRMKDLEESEKEHFKAKETLKKKESECTDNLSDLTYREKKFQNETQALKDELTLAINAAKSAEATAKYGLQVSENIKKEYEQKKSDLEKSHAKEKAKLEEEKKVFKTESDSYKEALRKRELGIVQREKDLDNLKLEYKTKIEDFEIQQAREKEVIKEASPKVVKKK